MAAGEGREKKFKRQPYDYQFKLKVIDYYATTDTASTIAQFFPGVADSRNCAKRKLMSKWNQQRERIEASARSTSTAHQQRARSRGHATTLPHAAEASIVKWINDFRRDGVPVLSAMLKMRAFEEAEELGIPRKVFAASWQRQSGFMKRHRYSFRVKSHTRQTAPPDALAQAKAFAEEIARAAEIEGITTIYNADQTAVFFELLPRTTIAAAGSKTVWVKCRKKEKERMTTMPSKTKLKRAPQSPMPTGISARDLTTLVWKAAQILVPNGYPVEDLALITYRSEESRKKLVKRHNKKREAEFAAA